MAEVAARTDLLARVRRDAERSVLRARNGLKHLSGVGRPPMAVTPKDTVWESEKVQLWRYRSDHRTMPTPFLFVHSLVSRSYVFDLTPGNSFVSHLLDRGFDVFLIDWGVPDELDAGNTLETYCDWYLPELVSTVVDVSGQPDVNMFGYCMGGMLALLYAAGHHEDPLRSLAVMATPIDFSKMGAMTGLMQEGRVDPDDVIDPTGNVPADVMLNSFRIIAPTGDLVTYANLWQNMWNDEFVASHQIMTQWAREHIPFPGAAFRQIADLFARRNLFATGRIPMGDRVVDLADITVPFLNIVGEKDHIVPPECNAPLMPLIGSKQKEELRLPAGHAGLIVGRTAHRRNIPAMADWLEKQ